MNQISVKPEILFTRVVNYMVSGGVKAVFIFHFLMIIFNKDHISFFSFFAAGIRMHCTTEISPTSAMLFVRFFSLTWRTVYYDNSEWLEYVLFRIMK